MVVSIDLMDTIKNISLLKYGPDVEERVRDEIIRNKDFIITENTTEYVKEVIKRTILKKLLDIVSEEAYNEGYNRGYDEGFRKGN